MKTTNKREWPLGEGVWSVPVPGLPGFALCRDGGVAMALPRALWRPALCWCSACEASNACPCGEKHGHHEAWWDALRVHPNHHFPWTVHWPELTLV